MTAVFPVPPGGVVSVRLGDVLPSDVGRPVIVLTLTESVRGVLDMYQAVMTRDVDGTADPAGEVTACIGVVVDDPRQPRVWEKLPLSGFILIDRSVSVARSEPVITDSTDENALEGVGGSNP